MSATVASPASRLTRGRLTEFVESHHVAWEVTMAGLALVYLGVGFLTDEGKGTSPAVLAFLAGVFIVEFSARLWDASDRKAYLRGHWIDIVSCLPLVGGLRSIRILRLIRLAAAARVFTLAEHEAEEHHVDREGMWYFGPILFLVWVAAASAYWSLEHGVNPAVKTFADALYWAFITATTVGYGDVTPVTPEGRILAGVLIFVGIGLVGFASAQLTQRWLRSSAPNPRQVMHRLDSVDAQLAELRTLLLQQVETR